MPPASSVVTTASSMSSSDDDISLPSSPSPSPEPSSDPYAFSSSEDEVAAAPPPKKKSRWLGNGVWQRDWPTADEVVLLEAAAAHREQHGRLPNRDDLSSALGGRLPHVSAEQAIKRLHTLRGRYDASVRQLRRGAVPVSDGDVRVFRLSKRVWEGAPEPARRPRPAPHQERRGFEELRGMYPCLASVVEAIEAKQQPPGGGTGLMLRRAFGRMGDEQAAALEAKVKRQRLAELKADARLAELRNAVAGALLALEAKVKRQKSAMINLSFSFFFCSVCFG